MRAPRQQAEREIVLATIVAAQARGFKLSGVCNGEDDVRTTNVSEVMEHAFACDEAHVYFAEPDQSNAAWFWLVLGNEGWSVISDYTVNLSDAVDDTDKLVEEWEAAL